MADKQLIGVISDTHGLVRPEVSDVFKGTDLIVHAGDIGSRQVIEGLEKIGPVVAVRGNVDKREWARSIPKTEIIERSGLFLYVIHDINELDLDPVAAGFSLIISGHSHRPSCRRKGSILFLNPGSAGPRRFNLPVSVALVHIRGRELEAEIIELAGTGPKGEGRRLRR